MRPPHTIAGDISRELKRTITEPDVLAALKALTGAGLVQPFIFDETKKAYRSTELGSAPDEKLWFMATKAGKSHAASAG